VDKVDSTSREILELFCSKIEELKESRYLRNAISGSVRWTASCSQGSTLTHEREGPDEEAVKAFLLTMRMFLQKNEKISVRRIGQLVSNSDVCHINLKNDFAAERNALNTYLDASGVAKFVIGDRPLTQRDILDTFLYGMYAHNNDHYLKELKGWEKMGLLIPLRSEFDNIVLDVLGKLHNLRLIVLEILKA
jgi:hypothetical protein